MPVPAPATEPAGPAAGLTAAIVVAAGQGVRLGAGVPKALALVGGVPLVVHAVRTLLETPGLDIVVVAAPQAELTAMQELCGPDVHVVAGGATRHESVRRALERVPDRVDVVLVHDAARAFAPVQLISAVVRAVRAGADAVIPALPVVDTIKRVSAAGSGASEVVVETVDRSTLRAVQTPQGFRRSAFVQAHACTAGPVSDDAGVVEALGGVVVVIPGSPEAFKVTGPLDLLLAEALVGHRSREAPR